MADELPPGVTIEDVRFYKRLIARCWVVAGLVIELPLEALDQLSAQAETSGPALYPNIWRANAKAIMEDRELIRALVAAKRDVLTTSPSLATLAPLIGRQADDCRPRLDAAFRDLFSRRELAPIPPAVVLTALVRFIGDRAPELARGDDSTRDQG